MSDITDERPGAWSLGGGETALGLVGVGWILLAAFWAVPAILTIDGFVYHAMIDAFARNGSLFVENGLAEYESSALRIFLMHDIDGRLAPQYPGGWGILAAPAYIAGGLRGVMLINAVASALTLPLIWLTARALFADRALATQAALIWGLATYAVDYALAVWPHGITTCLVAAAVTAVATGWRRAGAAELHGALAAGLALGIGLNIRVDALIAAAPLAVWLLAAGRRPYAALGMLLAGLAPGLVAATAINLAKFGIASPLTYGPTGGATNLGYYVALLPLMAVGAAVSLALGLARVRAALSRPRVLAAASLLVLAAALAVPVTREVMVRIAAGFWVLVVDFQALPMPARGATELPDGTFRMFGLAKKSLLQSLPYAAAVLVLLPRLVRGPDRHGVGFCMLFVALSIVPFAYGSWHGGLANNMRYFLNFLPVLAILAAVALREITALAGGRAAVALVAVLGVGGVVVLHAVEQGYPFEFVFQHTLPIAVAAAIAALAVLVVVTRGPLRGTLATALRSLVTFGLMIAFVSAWVFDLQIARQVRERNADIAALAADLPPDALLITPAPAAAGFRLNRPPALTARTMVDEWPVYPQLRDLVERAQAEGRPVFAQHRVVAEAMVQEGLARDFAPRYGFGRNHDIPEKFEIYEMTPPSGAAAPGG